MVKFNEALQRAFEMGATLEEIDKEAEFQRRGGDKYGRRCMIAALRMHPWNNTKVEQVRLAAAIRVERELRK